MPQCLSDNREEWVDGASVWIMTGGLGGPWVPDMTCALCPGQSDFPQCCCCCSPLRCCCPAPNHCRRSCGLLSRAAPCSGSLQSLALPRVHSPGTPLGRKITISIHAAKVYSSPSAQIMAPHYWSAKSVWKNCFDCILSYGAVCLNVMRSSLGFLIG